MKAKLPISAKLLSELLGDLSLIEVTSDKCVYKDSLRFV